MQMQIDNILFLLLKYEFICLLYLSANQCGVVIKTLC